ncbi:MAG: xanthine dehydrogenase family protein molybdopterin-binding subunit [Chloroflexota bacterium]|nr:xanthine dehydrogenase family protein molybdopterin-binding subunit [Chloroflexota bacterium]
MSASLIGQPLDRVDGRLKVTGGADYTADITLPHLTYGVLATSPIARGRIVTLETSTAEQAPGVLAVFTYRTMPRLHPVHIYPVGAAGQSYIPLQDEHIQYAGQYVALVVAETLEQATFAATRLRIEYEEEAPLLMREDRLSEAFVPTKSVDAQRGDLERGLAEADVRVDATYTTPMEHHNPMELAATTASWDGEQLTVYDATQWIFGVRNTLGTALGIPQEQVRVISHFVGGAFGSKGMTWPHTLLAAVAARQVARPVKVVLSRQHMYSGLGHRPHTVQQVTLGARRDGVLTALAHRAASSTSPFDEFLEPMTVTTRRVYACPNAVFTQQLLRVTLGTPTVMRAPGEATGMFALESAMDELAYQLDIDPLELRVRNHAYIEPQSGLPWSSKSLLACYRQGAERFGWQQRTPAPRSQRKGDQFVGWGMATAMYPVYLSPAAAMVRLLENGYAVVEAGSQDIGTGTYTVLAQLVAETLGLSLQQITVALGDTHLPPTPVAGGSRTMGSLGPAVLAAAQDVRRQAIHLALTDARSPLCGCREEAITIEEGRLVSMLDPAQSESYADLLKRTGKAQLVSYQESIPREGKPEDKERTFMGLNASCGPITSTHAMYSFGAHFVEVQVEPDLGTIQVTRVVGTFAAGRIINEKTARSQLLGGFIFGLGMALLEETQIDPHLGRIMNANLGEYHVPVHADVPEIDISFVQEHDPSINALGAKGVGELGTVGAAAAIANAVYHATGRRVRTLPIRLDTQFSVHTQEKGAI